MEASALKRAKQAVRAARKHAPYHDRRRLNRKEFHVYINAVVEAMVGGEEVRAEPGILSWKQVSAVIYCYKAIGWLLEYLLCCCHAVIDSNRSLV